MKKLILLTAILGLSLSGFAQKKKHTIKAKTIHSTVTKSSSKTTYDAALAKKLGADDYGMKKYIVAFLKTGKTLEQDSVIVKNIQLAHLKNIQHLGDIGKLAIAGPFLDNQATEGMFIFNVETIEEAKQLTETDPAIKAGLLEIELHPWYGSAALMEVTRIHNTLQKKGITN
jgi:uncharacterized protein YciI